MAVALTVPQSAMSDATEAGTDAGVGTAASPAQGSHLKAARTSDARPQEPIITIMTGDTGVSVGSASAGQPVQVLPIKASKTSDARPQEVTRVADTGVAVGTASAGQPVQVLPPKTTETGDARPKEPMITIVS